VVVVGFPPETYSGAANRLLRVMAWELWMWRLPRHLRGGGSVRAMRKEMYMALLDAQTRAVYDEWGMNVDK
jgi:hypothetical protein